MRDMPELSYRETAKAAAFIGASLGVGYVLTVLARLGVPQYMWLGAGTTIEAVLYAALYTKAFSNIVQDVKTGRDTNNTTQ